MQPLDLHIEHRMRVHCQPERRLDVPRETLLVALLHRGPLLLERRVLGELEEALELGELLEEVSLRDAQGLVDEVAETGVALVQPATRGDAVRDVAEPVTKP